MAKKNKKTQQYRTVKLGEVRLIYPHHFALSDEGPMDGHLKLGPWCVPYSWCHCHPTIVNWNALTRQRTYEHRHRIH